MELKFKWWMSRKTDARLLIELYGIEMVYNPEVARAAASFNRTIWN